MGKLTTILCLILPIALGSLLGCTRAEERRFFGLKSSLEEAAEEYAVRQDKKIKALGPNDPYIISECSGLLEYGIGYARTAWTTNFEFRKFFSEYYGDKPLKRGKFRPIGSPNVCEILSFYNVVSPSERPDWLAQKKRKETQRLKETCSTFGYKDGSKEMTKCMFDLYKLQELGRQNQATVRSRDIQNKAVIDSMDSNAAAQRAIAEEQLKAQQLKDTMEMLRRVNPPTPGPGETKNIDQTCVNQCLATGKSIFYCRSDCSY